MGQQPSVPVPEKKLQVIAPGLPRTATASFSAALSILLDGPVYHGGTQVTMGPPIEIKSWMNILRLWLSLDPSKRAGQHEFDVDQEVCDRIAERLDGYVAVSDAPAAQLVPDLLRIYPDAKVICTVRDPAAWAKSHEQIAGLATMWFLRAVLLPLPGMRHFVSYIGLLARQWDRVYGKERPGEEAYHRHIAWLQGVVPKDRLVFFDVKDGWEPLCKALGKEVPNVPFPRINDSEAIESTAQYHVRRGIRRWAGIVVVVAVATAWLVKY